MMLTLFASPSPLHFCLATGLAHRRYPASFFKKSFFLCGPHLKKSVLKFFYSIVSVSFYFVLFLVMRQVTF